MNLAATPVSEKVVRVSVNGTTYEYEVPTRRLLVHFLRDDLALTGTHIGCDTGSCGACTVHLNGVPVKSCAVLAVQVDGARSADPGVAADVRPGEGEVIAQEMDEQAARRHLVLVRHAVHGHGHDLL